MCCSFLIVFQQQIQHPGFELIVILSAFLSELVNLFSRCYFGKMATESYENMADSLFKCNWYDLPTKLQKYIIIMIGNTQTPIYYHGFGLAVLNLLTFNKVSKT